MGASVLALHAVAVAARMTRPVLRPVVATVPRPAMPRAVAPTRLLGPVRARGSTQLQQSGRELSALLDRLVPAVLDELLRRSDLTGLILRYVDVNGIAGRLDVDAVVDRVDVDAVVDRIDLAGLAEQVIEEVDLSDIIRESTGAMASGTVRDARMQAILADQAVSRVRDRLRLRRGRRPGAVLDADGQLDAPLPTQRRPGS